MLTIALPKGRLLRAALERLAAAGLAPAQDPATSRKLVIPALGAAARFLVLKDPDVPVYVERGVADLGIVGANEILESGCDVLVPLELGFGRCRLVLASAPGKELDDGRTLKVATKYPRLSARLLGELGRAVELLTLAGSVELAATVGLCDAIVDLVETGKTLAENGLVVREELMEVSARLIANRAAYRLNRAEVHAAIDALDRSTEEKSSEKGTGACAGAGGAR